MKIEDVSCQPIEIFKDLVSSSSDRGGESGVISSQIHSFSSDCLRISDAPLPPPDYNAEPGSSSLRYFAQSSNPDIRSPRKMPNASALIVNIVIGGWKGGIKNTTTI